MGKSSEASKLYVVTNSENEEKMKEFVSGRRLRADWAPELASNSKAFSNIDAEMAESMKRYTTRYVPDSYYGELKVKDDGTTSKKDN